jgi:hypothetical protein
MKAKKNKKKDSKNAAKKGGSIKAQTLTEETINRIHRLEDQAKREEYNRRAWGTFAAGMEHTRLNHELEGLPENQRQAHRHEVMLGGRLGQWTC